MRHILVYSDSLAWGIIPGTRRRLSFDKRWPGVLENALLASGSCVRVTEDCLNGRRTAFDAPDKPGRNGSVGLEQKIEIHSPLDLVILMLGINDFQSVHQHSVDDSAAGMTALINGIRKAPIEPGMPIPKILLVAPPMIGRLDNSTSAKFSGAAEKSAGLATAYAAVARQTDCQFFDAGSAVTTSPIDGVHLDADQHNKLGHALAIVVAATLYES